MQFKYKRKILNFLLNQKINTSKYCINPKRFLHLHHKSILFKKNCFYKDEWRDRLKETRATCDKNRARCQFLPNQQFGNIKTERYVINSFLQIPTFSSSDVAPCCVTAFIFYMHKLLYALLLIIST